MKVMNEL